jgi:predicted acyltransferase
MNKSLLHRKILRRSLIIFLLGLFLNAFPGFELTELRFTGVLQRIAIVYLLAAMIVLHSKITIQATVAGGILLLYWAMMAWIPVPGHGAGVLTPEGNLAAYLDSQLLPGRMWQGTWDPEGILSTLPSVSTTLIGVLTGHWVRSGRSRSGIAAGMIVFGWIAIGLAGFWDIWFPINKNIWTSSFVLLTAGIALQFLGLFYWLIEVKGMKSWFYPAVVFGMNPITVYVLSGMLMDLLYVIPVGSNSLQVWFFDRAFLSWASPANASLAFAICYVVLWVLIMDLFYRKRVFIKI